MIWTTIQWAYIILTTMAILVTLNKPNCKAADVVLFLPGAYSIKMIYHEVGGYIHG